VQEKRVEIGCGVGVSQSGLIKRWPTAEKVKMKREEEIGGGQKAGEAAADVSEVN